MPNVNRCFSIYINMLVGNRGYCGIPWAGPESFPLDCPRRLARHIINDTVDSLDLVDDARCRPAKKSHIEREEIRGHTVGRGYRAQRAGEIIRPAVTHDANSPHR